MPLNNRRIQKIQPTVVRAKPKTVTRDVKPIVKQVPKNNLGDRFQPAAGQTEKIWDNEVVYIIGGGPSLKDFDWNLLAGKKVIAINRAFEVLPNADVLYWTDARFYRWFKNKIDDFTGLKVTCRPVQGSPGDIIVLKQNTAVKIDMRPDFISSGNNSGFGAINLAAKLGAKRIYLLGYDMVSREKDTHWHSGYEVSHNHAIYSKMIAQMSSIPGELRALDIDIFNANPKSNMTVFRRVTLEAALNNNPIIPSQNF
jgi:hypothetical protein